MIFHKNIWFITTNNSPTIEPLFVVGDQVISDRYKHAENVPYIITITKTHNNLIYYNMVSGIEDTFDTSMIRHVNWIDKLFNLIF